MLNDNMQRNNIINKIKSKNYEFYIARTALRSQCAGADSK